jgi:hypothetical protein
MSTLALVPPVLAIGIEENMIMCVEDNRSDAIDPACVSFRDKEDRGRDSFMSARSQWSLSSTPTGSISFTFPFPSAKGNGYTEPTATRYTPSNL